MADNHFTEIALPNRQFRGFDAHNDTRAIDGRDPADMGGPERTVMGPGKPSSYDSCGRWLDHAEIDGATTLGFVHAETACDYAIGQTHMSMAAAVSNDGGLTWHDLGQIITGTDAPTARKNTGEGDCTVANGQDGYRYAYCFRPRDGGLIVARSPVSMPGPGHWTKFFQGAWDQPGLGGDATRLAGGSGVSVAWWTTGHEFVLTGWVKGGLGLFLTIDHTTLVPLSEPLLAVDPGQWARPAPSELIFYPVLLDAGNGSNQLSNRWMLVYAYIPPNADGNQKYLVFRDVTVSPVSDVTEPHVGVQLARWYAPTLHDRWSTTAAVPAKDNVYTLDTTSGYLMTAAPGGVASVELEDCVSQRPGHPDHLLAEKGFCEAHAYQRLRTAGWVYAQSAPNTIPLYRCYDARMQSHFASNTPDCEKLGAAERLLGYALKQ
ncbi:hypothetical protein [Paraburkholderia megapolitana]|nr:hypothetical protein [Paraburkholderia megapolitana]QDQ83513.1 hypothetical protein FNZ07_20235 [Paraburkholderia megapolitana]